MTPEKALQLVDQVCASVSLNRDSHVQVQQAIKVLSDLVGEPKEEEKVEEEKTKK